MSYQLFKATLKKLLVSCNSTNFFLRRQVERKLLLFYQISEKAYLNAKKTFLNLSKKKKKSLEFL